MTERIIARPLFSIRDALPADVTRHVADVGNNGQILVAAHCGPDELFILEWKDGRTRQTTVRDARVDFDRVQPLADGVLLAGWRKPMGDTRPNAVVCNWSGAVVDRLFLGEGIADVRTSPDDTIWVSFMDEGVALDEIGNNALVAFDRHGKPSFEYSALQAKTKHPLDVYAINVVGNDDVWLYFYAEFPIVHVKDGRYENWRCPVRGARALAIDGNRVLLAKTDDAPECFHIVELGELRERWPFRARCEATILAQGGLATQAGPALSQARFVGVGSKMYAVQDATVHVIDRW